MPANDLLLYALSFVAIWLGSGLIIRAINGFSRTLHVSSFSLSFFVLGILTSIPEFAVGLTAIVKNDPQIFVGNLLGGIPVLFLFAIPSLAVVGRGIRLAHKLSTSMIFLTLAVIALPAAFALDQRITTLEAITLILVYLLLFFSLGKTTHSTLGQKKSKTLLQKKSYSLINMGELLAGVVIVFISSRFIVDTTLAFSQIFHISPFLMSLTVLSLGTNLPELSLGLRSIFFGNKDIALGDYLGSAAANVLLLGILALVNGGEIATPTNFTTIFLFVIIGIGLFYVFSRSNKDISQKEGLILLAVYALFVAIEFIKR